MGFAQRHGQRAFGARSHAEGSQNVAGGYSSHVEGEKNLALAPVSHAEGLENTVEAAATGGHAEGWGHTLSAIYTHAEGSKNTVTKEYSHAEGSDNQIHGKQGHVEGKQNEVYAMRAHAEGGYNKIEEAAEYGHAEGSYTTVGGKNAHAEGYQTKAMSEYQHVSGKFNEADTSNKYAEIVGGGTGDKARKNIRTLDWNGNATYAGDVKAGDVSLQKIGNTVEGYSSFKDNTREAINNLEKEVYDVAYAEVADDNSGSIPNIPYDEIRLSKIITYYPQYLRPDAGFTFPSSFVDLVYSLGDRVESHPTQGTATIDLETGTWQLVLNHDGGGSTISSGGFSVDFSLIHDPGVPLYNVLEQNIGSTVYKFISKKEAQSTTVEKSDLSTELQNEITSVTSGVASLRNTKADKTSVTAIERQLEVTDQYKNYNEVTKNFRDIMGDDYDTDHGSWGIYYDGNPDRPWENVFHLAKLSSVTLVADESAPTKFFDYPVSDAFKTQIAEKQDMIIGKTNGQVVLNFKTGKVTTSYENTTYFDVDYVDYYDNGDGTYTFTSNVYAYDFDWDAENNPLIYYSYSPFAGYDEDDREIYDEVISDDSYDEYGAVYFQLTLSCADDNEANAIVERMLTSWEWNIYIGEIFNEVENIKDYTSSTLINLWKNEWVTEQPPGDYTSCIEISTLFGGAYIDPANVNIIVTEPKETTASSTGLPEVSTSDNGSFLRVVNGKWAVVALEYAEGGSF